MLVLFTYILSKLVVTGKSSVFLALLLLAVGPKPIVSSFSPYHISRFVNFQKKALEANASNYARIKFFKAVSRFEICRLMWFALFSHAQLLL